MYITYTQCHTHTIIIQNENISAVRVNNDIGELSAIDIEIGSECLIALHNGVLQYGNGDLGSFSG